MVPVVFQVLLCVVLISASDENFTPDPNYFFVNENAQQHVLDLNSRLTELDNELSPIFSYEITNSELASNVELLRTKVNEAYNIGKTNCVPEKSFLEYEQQIYLNLKKCQDDISSGNFKEIKDEIITLIVKIQEVDSKLNDLLNNCQGNYLCEYEVLSANQIEEAILYQKGNDYITKIFSKIINRPLTSLFISCTERLNDSLLEEIKKGIEDISTCLATPVDS